MNTPHLVARPEIQGEKRHRQRKSLAGPGFDRELADWPARIVLGTGWDAQEIKWRHSVEGFAATFLAASMVTKQLDGAAERTNPPSNVEPLAGSQSEADDCLLPLGKEAEPSRHSELGRDCFPTICPGRSRKGDGEHVGRRKRCRFQEDAWRADAGKAFVIDDQVDADSPRLLWRENQSDGAADSRRNRATRTRSAVWVMLNWSRSCTGKARHC